MDRGALAPKDQSGWLQEGAALPLGCVIARRWAVGANGVQDSRKEKGKKEWSGGTILIHLGVAVLLMLKRISSQSMVKVLVREMCSFHLFSEITHVQAFKDWVSEPSLPR